MLVASIFSIFHSVFQSLLLKGHLRVNSDFHQVLEIHAIFQGTRCTWDVSSARPFDFEKVNNLTFIVIATDGNGLQMQKNFVLEILDSNDAPMVMIQSLFHQLMVNMGKFLPIEGKVHENNECRKAQVIFADLFLLRQILPHINHKLMK